MIIYIHSVMMRRSKFFILQPQLRVPMAPGGLLDFSKVQEPLYGETVGANVKNNVYRS